MNEMQSVARAIAYIESHLTDEMTVEQVAAEAGYSPFHFHRIFTAVTRSSVSEYIRGRRLTYAAYDLFHTSLRIIEIAVKYHFSSQEAFTRSFQRMFSITPGQFRKQKHMKDTLFRAMEKKPLDELGLRHIREGMTLEPEILSVSELTLVGLEIRGLASEHIQELWSSFRQRAAELEHSRVHPSIFYALIELTGLKEEVSYTACVEVGREGRTPDGMATKVLPSATYAVFSHKGTVERIPDTFQYIYSAWLPKSGNIRLNQPEFARYDHRYLGPMHEASELDIYIPIGLSTT
ncbi:GyrI-like domain-containing protein [Paenibacillus sp. YYML68]|uniref:AraC family transcriptional regulator n=1 Tax=Paenibacillus sp. YYML68 TaxID=2909250 RepID=UPI002490D4F7|nr:GyrI-like domain-containing protein [Paenibacillus sp. YYML68]